MVNTDETKKSEFLGSSGSSEKGSVNGGIDQSSFYYLHPSDSNSQLQVGDPLTPTNYAEWVVDVTDALIVKNKFSFVDGTLPKPKEDPELQAWTRCDAHVKGWLRMAMTKEVRSSVRYAKSAREIWVDLKERFGHGTLTRGYELRRLISALWQEKLSVSSFYTQLRTFWEEANSISPSEICTCGLCQCGLERRIRAKEETARLFDFLMGLDESFGIVRSQILSMKPPPTLEEAYNIVANDEHQRLLAQRRKPTPEAAAFATQNEGERTRNDGERPRTKCTHCGKTGHLKETCFELIGWPSRDKNGQRERQDKRRRRPNEAQPRAAKTEVESSPIPGFTMEQLDQLKKLLIPSKSAEDPSAHMAGMFLDGSEWIIDSGCNEHITRDASVLNGESIDQDCHPVRIPNGDSIPVKRIGSVELTSGLKLKRVLYVPEFKCNLLSVSRLTQENNVALIFLRDMCIIQDLHSRSVIGRGILRDGLYYLKILSSQEQFAFTADGKRSVSEDVWHNRLGHPSSSQFAQLSRLFSSVPSSVKGPCHSCFRAKQTRIPFPTSSIKTSDCFELIHVDIWGGYQVASLSGAHYFLTVVDDFSRGVWVYLLKFKSEVARYLLMFCEMVATQYNKRVKRIQADNGLEFKTAELREFYEKSGIILQTSCTDTPQQNGVVERKHRHILEVARALRFQAGLPIRFWGECILTATYLINRLPTTATGKTPFEILFGKTALYDQLRVFGCLVYAKDNHGSLHKFADRGRAGVFLGYAATQKGYKIYDLMSKRIIMSRDVVFHERYFPFQAQDPREFHWIDPDVFDEVSVREVQPPIPVAIEELPSAPSHVHGHAPIPPNVSADKFPSPLSAELSNSNGSLSKSNERQNGPLLAELSKRNERQHGHDLRRSPIPFNLTEQEPSPPVHQSPLPSTSSPPKEAPLGRGLRQRWPSKRLAIYDTCVNLVSNVKYPISNHVSYARATPRYRAFLAALTRTTEPRFFHEAVRYAYWREAMKAEIRALEANRTWSLVYAPPNVHLIDSRWVFRIKYRPDGTIERFKARLVAKGYTQVEGLDYHETFAPVAKLVTVRCLLAVAVSRGWFIHQLDVNNAFLHGDLQEEVYMKVPPGFAEPGDTRVCRLHKSIYGLKQASRNWYQKFTAALCELGFRSSPADHSLFVFRRGEIFVVALIYVDDVILAGTDMNFINHVKKFLDHRFSIKDLGPLRYFLGLEVARSPQGLVVSQRKYVLDILEEAGVLGSRPSTFPVEQNHQLTKPSSEILVDGSAYRRLVGRLLYLTVSRPDITYGVNILSRFVHAPTQAHMDAAMRILRYLKLSPGQGLYFPAANDLHLHAYCDADWGGCQSTRRSTSGFCIFLGTTPISWRTKQQKVVARSSAEAEYRAMASTVSEIVWLRWLLSELGVTQSCATPLRCDNQAALHIASNPVFHERTKHVEMDCYFVRERVTSGVISPVKVSSELQIADLFTKGLGSDRFRFLLSKLNVRDLHRPACGGVLDQTQSSRPKPERPMTAPSASCVSSCSCPSSTRTRLMDSVSSTRHIYWCKAERSCIVNSDQ
ncbi:unnamed protein product [Linum trigynum]|uniref:Uncharacterized protein n=1 Tax=Linum trigynum TaxID=586398 RepID=A0AAV2DI57_9ROSI